MVLHYIVFQVFYHCVASRPSLQYIIFVSLLFFPCLVLARLSVSFHSLYFNVFSPGCAPHPVWITCLDGFYSLSVMGYRVILHFVFFARYPLFRCVSHLTVDIGYASLSSSRTVWRYIVFSRFLLVCCLSPFTPMYDLYYSSLVFS